MSKRKELSKSRRERERSHQAAKLTLPKRLLRATPVLLSLILLSVVFSRVGVLHKFETVALDTQMRLNAPPAQTVAIVNIDDTDYQSRFESKSPLRPDRLHDLVAEIARGKPKVIGIDIDTSDNQFSGFQVDPSWPPLIWEREVKGAVPKDEKEKPEPKPVLGDRGAEFRDSGLALLRSDSEDNVIRKYQRFIQTTEGPLPSFPWAIVHKFDPDKAKTLDQFAGPLFIGYAGDPEGDFRFEFTAAKVQELSEQWKDHPDASPIKGMIVLLGGSYLGEDQHETPLGKMLGLRIMASVVETELRGGGYAQPNKFTLALLEIFDGFVLILFFHVMRPIKALLMSALMIPFLALVCSLVSFASFSRWAYFAPVLLGVLVFELYEHYRRTMIPHVYHQISDSKADVKISS